MEDLLVPKVQLFAKKADLIPLLSSTYHGCDFPQVDEDAAIQTSRSHVHAIETNDEISLRGPEQDDGLSEEAETHQTVSTGMLLEGVRTGGDISDSNESFIKAHVSASHLVEASTYFETLLTGSFHEASGEVGGNIRRISLRDVYAPAFLLIMNIAHSRHLHLPKHITSEMLFQLCILLDMYDMHELSILQTDVWFEALIKEVPDSPAPNLHHWTFICWVLKKDSQFKAVTATIQKYYINSDAGDIPLPALYNAKVEQLRRDVIARCARSLEALLDEYGDTANLKCSHEESECDALVLGSLIRALREANLYPPASQVPQYTVDELMRALRNLKLARFCGLVNVSYDSLSWRARREISRHAVDTFDCGCAKRIESIREDLFRETKGITLESVLPITE